MGCCIDAVCCLTIWIYTLAICFFNTVFCISLSLVVTRTSWVGYGFLVLFFLWNVTCIHRILCLQGSLEFLDEMRGTCLASCSSVMVLLAITFTLVTRYHYYERWPKYPEEREGLHSSLLVHKIGLTLLVAGIPVIYGCEWKQLINDKKMIYKVIVDFSDIYEMANLLALGAPTCTPPLHSINGYNNMINGERYNQDRHDFNCIESSFSKLKKEGSIEIAVQFFCSFSFLLFRVIYKEALFESRNSNDSFKKYIMTAKLLQDIPFFIILIWVWASYGFETNQFIFLMKNVISLGVISLEFYEPDGSNEQNPTPSQTNCGFDEA